MQPKICLFLLSFIILSYFAQNQIIKNLPNPDIVFQKQQPIQNIDQPKTSIKQNINQINKIINTESNKAQLNFKETEAFTKLDLYTLANTIFNSQKYFGDMCNRCKKLQYIAFRQGNYYLTAKNTFLKYELSSSPLNSQLFIAEQQIDGTWAFKSLTEGKYIRASNDGITINYQTFIGPWERWYMQRHGNHIHIQSAQFQHFYWASGGSILQQLNGGASSVIVQHWPKLQWLWNW